MSSNSVGGGKSAAFGAGTVADGAATFRRTPAVLADRQR